MVEPQPTKIPEWNTGGSNRTEPTAGEKTTGWTLNDQPPSSYFNWLQYYTGAWLEWLNERVYKGSAETDLTVSALQPDTTGNGGNLQLLGGSANTSGTGGDVIATAGAGLNGNVGGDLQFTAGSSVDTNGGDAYFRGGSVTGTDRSAGVVRVATGAATGIAHGDFRLDIAEAESGGSGSGSYVNNPTEYFEASGASARKDIRLKRRLLFFTSTDTARGDFVCTPKAQPTAPTAGDHYFDTNTYQQAVYDGSRYHNVNPIVYNNSDFAVTGENHAASSGTEYVLRTKPYGGSVSANPLRHTIGANTLRVGTVVRVRGIFLITAGSGTTYPTPKVYAGSVGASPYTSPTGLQLLPYDRSSLFWSSCAFTCDLRVRGPLTASCAVDYSYVAMYEEGGSPARPVRHQTFFSSPTIDATSDLDIFATLLLGTASGYYVELTSFLVEVI